MVNELLKFTGERFVPEVSGNIELEHMHRYFFANELCADKIVLDIACGEGYGTELLSKNAQKVYGVDISEEAISHAKKRYNIDNVEFIQGDCTNIPLESGSVDIIASFETIEHHDKHGQMLKELKRVLKPDGILVISSPDKYEYSEKHNYTNPYHVKELTEVEFKDLINSHFNFSNFLGQRIVYGSSLLSEKMALGKTYYNGVSPSSTKTGLIEPLYWVAVASNSPIPPLYQGVYKTDINNAEEIGHLKQHINDLANLNNGLKQSVEESANQSSAYEKKIEELTASNTLLTNSNHSLKLKCEDFKLRLEGLEDLISKKDAIIASAVDWQKDWKKKIFHKWRPSSE